MIDNSKTPSQNIRVITEKIRELKRLDSLPKEAMTPITFDRQAQLRDEFEYLNTLFGKTSTVEKATLYYLDQHYKSLQKQKEAKSKAIIL